MSELRWHPLLEEWVITATHRQDRTFLPPANYCPICPTKKDSFPTEVPEEEYEIVVFDNKFPSLKHPAPKPAVEGSNLYKVRPAEGICEVVSYTSKHNGTLTDLLIADIRNLVDVWTDRYIELGKKDFIDYVLIFENKGKDIGVTLYHPHGQIYAFPFIPPKVQKELESAARHKLNTGRCLFCDVINEEKTDSRRTVAENDYFYAAIPFFARYPYEIYIFSKNHHPHMALFNDEEKAAFANILKVILLKYDNLFNISLPYMMIMHQAPTDGANYDHYHFHVEFHPPNRTANKLKYIAGCETGAMTYINDTLAEEKAAELRAALPSTEENTFIYYSE